ncbi:MAG: SDR family oxidoreductase [Pseudomonadota bacterium]
MTQDTPIALVTGASRGLGYATALALGTAGHHVIAVARTVGGLEELADGIAAAGGASTLVPLDITDDEGLARMGAAINARWGRLDLLVHAAAHAPPCAPLAQTAEKDLDRSFAVNARATARLILMLDPLLKAAPAGQAVIVTDDRADQPFFGAYAASKAAARAFATAWRAETRRTGPEVTLFTPAAMATALHARFYPGQDAAGLATPLDQAQALLRHVPGHGRAGAVPSSPGT